MICCCSIHYYIIFPYKLSYISNSPLKIWYCDILTQSFASDENYDFKLQSVKNICQHLSEKLFGNTAFKWKFEFMYLEHWAYVCVNSEYDLLVQLTLSDKKCVFQSGMFNGVFLFWGLITHWMLGIAWIEKVRTRTTNIFFVDQRRMVTCLAFHVECWLCKILNFY